MFLAAATPCDAVGRASLPALAQVSSAANRFGAGRNQTTSRCISPEPFEQLQPKTALMPSFTSFDHPSFPSVLRTIPRPPAGLWVKGQLPNQSQRSVAVVGSRAASGSGVRLAQTWAASLGSEGFAVVSGGALGIDAGAHEGSLSVGAPTYAVLGCGVDVVYPDRHSSLFARVARCGGLLSEYPPGTQPRPGQFPVRNRLIVGLAEAVLVIEARPRSGALVTARLAHRQGRRLLAVPGSSGTDSLLQSGAAVPVTTPAELFAALDGSVLPGASKSPLLGPAAEIVAALRAGMTTPAAISLYLGLPLSDVMAALVEAEMDGLIGRGAGSRYEVIYGH